ncbi:diguanylate cyclase domain-containing protein, partial [Campylobacter hyointestinalis]
MLYSQTKERSNRFALALRIAIPFIFVLFFWGYTFLKIDLFAKQDLVLFLALTLAYVYYTFFMIYQGFNSSFIDQNTKTFTKEKIKDIIQKSIKKQENRNIVMIGIKNLNEINQRYGFENLDQILRLFVIELEYFLKKKNLYNIPIGKYFDGYFLMLLDSKESALSHILKEFELYISKKGINNIEINTVFSMLPNSYDVNLNSTISALFYKILDDENSKKIDINDYEKMIYDTIQNRNFILKFQTIKDNKFDKDMIYLI